MIKKQITAQIILNTDEKAFFQEMAKKEGLSVSNFLRKKLGMSLLINGNNFINNNPRKKS